MTTAFIPPPVRHGSSFLHYHHHDKRSSSEVNIASQPKIFQGTDAVPQNQRVAVQRILEIHDALERKNYEDAEAVMRHDSAELSVDSFSTDFEAIIDLPNGEVRAFKYFLRKWDSLHHPVDPEFDEAVEPRKLKFEETAMKHFFRRIALWNENEELLEAAKREKRKRFHWNSVEKDSKDTKLSKLWLKERAKREQSGVDELKEITTREGLAQLLWTLMHDMSGPLAPEFIEECTAAVKWSYGIKC